MTLNKHVEEDDYTDEPDTMRNISQCFCCKGTDFECKKILDLGDTVLTNGDVPICKECAGHNCPHIPASLSGINRLWVPGDWEEDDEEVSEDEYCIFEDISLINRISSSNALLDPWRRQSYRHTSTPLSDSSSGDDTEVIGPVDNKFVYETWPQSALGEDDLCDLPDLVECDSTTDECSLGNSANHTDDDDPDSKEQPPHKSFNDCDNGYNVNLDRNSKLESFNDSDNGYNVNHKNGNCNQPTSEEQRERIEMQLAMNDDDSRDRLMYEMRQGLDGFSLTDEKWKKIKMTHTGLNGGTVSTDYFSSTPVRHDTVKTRLDFVKTVPERDSKSRTTVSHNDQVKTDVSSAQDSTAAGPQIAQVVDSPAPQPHCVMTLANWHV
jgi:hypothetical protein